MTAMAVIALVVVAVAAVVRFEVFCLRDLQRTTDAELQYLSRAGWIVLIGLVIPLGGILYLYLGRPR